MTHAVRVLTKRSLTAHPIELSSDLSEDHHGSSNTSLPYQNAHKIDNHAYYPSAPVLLSFHPDSASGGLTSAALCRSLYNLWDTVCKSYDMRDAIYTALRLLFFALQCGWSTLYAAAWRSLQTGQQAYGALPPVIRQVAPVQWAKPAMFGLLVYYFRIWFPFVPHAALALFTGVTVFIPSRLLANNIIFMKLLAVCLAVSGQLTALSPALGLNEDRVWQFNLILGKAAGAAFMLQLFIILSSEWSSNLNRAWVSVKCILLLSTWGQPHILWPLLMWLQKLQLICTLHADPLPLPPHLTSAPLLPPTAHPSNGDSLSSTVSSLLCVACLLYVPPGELHKSPLIPEEARWAVQWAVHVLGLGTGIMLCWRFVVRLSQQHHLVPCVRTTMPRKWCTAAAIVVLFSAPALLTQAGGSLYATFLVRGGHTSDICYAELVMKMVSITECLLALAATLQPNGGYWSQHWDQYQHQYQYQY